MEYDTIQEAGSQLTPQFGPGFTGIHNLGNSCYMNSVMQVLFTIPDFVKKFSAPADTIFQESAAGDPTEDFTVQMAKLARGTFVCLSTLGNVLFYIFPSSFVVSPIKYISLP